MTGPSSLKNINKMMLLTSPMGSKDLQRLTRAVSLRQASTRRSLPTRHYRITQRVRSGGRTLYIPILDDRAPAESFSESKGPDGIPKTIALYYVIARLMTLRCSTLCPSNRSVISSSVLNFPCGAGISEDITLSDLQPRQKEKNENRCDADLWAVRFAIRRWRTPFKG